MEEHQLIAYNPWAALTGETSPTISFEKRGRGRPRKHNIPQIIGKTTHKMGDSEFKYQKLTNTERLLLIDQFKDEYQARPLREALCVIAARFEISYQKAHDELSEYF